MTFGQQRTLEEQAKFQCVHPVSDMLPSRELRKHEDLSCLLATIDKLESSLVQYACVNVDGGVRWSHYWRTVQEGHHLSGDLLISCCWTSVRVL